MSSPDAVKTIRRLLEESAEAHRRQADLDLAPVADAARRIADALAAGFSVLIFGNGGSAGDAQHFAAELVGRFELERRGLRAVALTADTSILTAVANDYGYETVFSRQIEALGRPGDVAFGISTSGNSRNVELALRAASDGGLFTIGLTGRDGGRISQVVDLHLNVPEQSTARVQEVHRTLIHAICALIDGAN